MNWRPGSVFVFLIFVGWFIAPGAGHETPVQLPPPQSAGEAWNVIEQCRANIDQLLGANLPRDVAGQLANISIALRFLNSGASGERTAEIQSQSAELIGGEAELLRDSREADQAVEKTAPAWRSWKEGLGRLESFYPAETVRSEVYICPMHPMDRHLNASEKCSICGMALVRRHLPASSVYQRPGEATLKLTAKCNPLVVGQSADVLIRLTKADGSPVVMADLIETHTKKIHLLINDHSLSDYHHVHPTPTQTPGEYQFSFTPTRPGAYRIWADVVPADSGIQEYDIADLPAETQAQPIADRQTRLSSVVDGRRFDLAFVPVEAVVKSAQPIIGTISITGADGKPFTQLEPVMGAFAHVVGFSEDGKSVLHIHPSSREPKGPEDRAGPAFAFKFYAPAPGFMRLYCQVQIDGRDVFVPFNLTIAP